VTAEPRRLPAALRAFRHRDFRLFWFGQLVSNTGSWMQAVAQAWLVLELTNSPFLLGVVGALQFAPMLVLSFFAGALADRLPKRRLVMVSQSVLFAQALLLAVLVRFGRVEFWHVAVLALLYGVANTVDMPTRQSFVVEMVGRDDLMNAIALNSAVFNAARVVGPALAGLAIAHWGMSLAFFLNALSFVPVLAALAAIRTEGTPRAPTGRSMGEDIREGVRFALRTPRVTLTMAMVLAVSGFLFNNNVLVPLFARDVLGQGARGFGLLMATLGAGAVAGGVTLAVFGRGRPPVAALATPALVLGACTAALAATRSVAPAAALLLVMGFCGILFMAGSNLTVQLTVPDALRGRVLSLQTLVFAGSTPIGAFLVGSVAEAAGVTAALLVAAGGGLVSVLALLLWWNARDRGASLAAARPEGGSA
jgi:predicted MFS family arabinose efflux permease